jgi:hypothetical protein
MLSKSHLTIVFGVLLIFSGLVVTGYQVSQPHPAGVAINL